MIFIDNEQEKIEPSEEFKEKPVSYTHLDVYKRQELTFMNQKLWQRNL